MPVEIRELIIKVAVEEAAKAPQPAPNQAALVAECVAQVMEILAEKDAR